MTNIEIIEKMYENSKDTCKLIRQLVNQELREEPEVSTIDFIQAIINSIVVKGADSHANPSK